MQKQQIKLRIGERSALSATAARKYTRVFNIKVILYKESCGTNEAASNSCMRYLYRPVVRLACICSKHSHPSRDLLIRRHCLKRAFTSQALQPLEAAEMGKEKDKVCYQLKTPKGTKDCTVDPAYAKSPD